MKHAMHLYCPVSCRTAIRAVYAALAILSADIPSDTGMNTGKDRQAALVLCTAFSVATCTLETP